MRKQKGITLIALVITIIVLLILAGVSITALTDDEKGVVTKAKQAAQETEDASDKEDADIKEMMDYANSDVVEISFIMYEVSGVSDGEEIFVEESYMAEESMTWEEWVNSNYNTGGYYIKDDYLVVNADGTHDVCSTDDGTPICSVSLDDVIENNAIYVTCEIGEAEDPI